jgi:hypothetical protein
MSDVRQIARLLGGCLAALATMAVTASAATAACAMDCEDFAERSAVRTGPDGRPDVVVVGRSQQGSDASTSDSAVAVYNADGSPEAGFGGGDGAELLPISPLGRDEAHDVAVAPDGDLFVSGRADGDVYVARLNPDGSLDPACGGMDADPGVERFDPPGGDVRRAVLARTPDFVVAVQTATGEPGKLFKITDACELVPGFGSAGFAALEFGAASLTIVRDIAVDGDGNIFVGGGNAVAVGSRRPDGSVNTGFGNGTGFLPASPAMPLVMSLAPRPRGGLFFNAQSTAAWATGFFAADGRLVNSQFVGFGPGTHIAGGVAAGDGDVFATGRTPIGTTGVARKDGDTLADVTSFDTDGKNDFAPNTTGLDVQFVPGAGLVLSGFGRAHAAADADFTNHRVDATSGALLGTTTTDFSGQNPAPVGPAEPVSPGPPSEVPPANDPPVEGPPPAPGTFDLSVEAPSVRYTVDRSFSRGPFYFGPEALSSVPRLPVRIRNAGPDESLETGSAQLVAFGREADFLPESMSRLCRREGKDNIRCVVPPISAGNVYRDPFEPRIVVRDLDALLRRGEVRFRVEVDCTSPRERSCANNVATGTIRFDAAPDANLARISAILLSGTARPPARTAPATATAAQARARLARVEVAILRTAKGAKGFSGSPASAAQAGRCMWLKNRKAAFERRRATRGRCAAPRWLRARGTRNWSYRLARPLPPGSYVAYARATTTAGASEQLFTARDRNRRAFRVKR